MSNKTLKEIIEEAPASKIVKPQKIGAHNIKGSIWAYLRGFEELCLNRKDIRLEEIPVYQQWIKAQKEGYGIQIEGKQVFLTPIEPITCFCGPIDLDLGYVIHEGILSNGIDNCANLRENGVFGDPYEEYPTYLMRPNAMVTTYGRPNPFKTVTLHIDAVKLLEKRTVFVDPESIIDWGIENDELGDSYFIVGGIPKESIIRILPFQGEEVTLIPQQF